MIKQKFAEKKKNVNLLFHLDYLLVLTCILGTIY